VVEISAYVRIQWLHEQLFCNTYPSIKKLTENFEISYRQGQRDIEYMRDSLGAPIEYSAHRKGYFYAKPFSLPTLYLTADETNYMTKLAAYYDSLKLRPQVPYTTKIKILSKRKSYRLLDRFLRGKEGDYVIYEFHNVELFIGVLLSCGGDFEIIFPNWLRERVTEICKNVLLRHPMS